ncbi:hypothetical protein ACPR111641_15485 [Acinetobacter pragensis]
MPLDGWNFLISPTKHIKTIRYFNDGLSIMSQYCFLFQRIRPYAEYRAASRSQSLADSPKFADCCLFKWQYAELAK